MGQPRPSAEVLLQGGERHARPRLGHRFERVHHAELRIALVQDQVLRQQLRQVPAQLLRLLYGCEPAGAALALVFVLGRCASVEDGAQLVDELRRREVGIVEEFKLGHGRWTWTWAWNQPVRPAPIPTTRSIDQSIDRLFVAALDRPRERVSERERRSLLRARRKQAPPAPCHANGPARAYSWASDVQRIRTAEEEWKKRKKQQKEEEEEEEAD